MVLSCVASLNWFLVMLEDFGFGLEGTPSLTCLSFVSGKLRLNYWLGVIIEVMSLVGPTCMAVISSYDLVFVFCLFIHFGFSCVSFKLVIAVYVY